MQSGVSGLGTCRRPWSTRTCRAQQASNRRRRCAVPGRVHGEDRRCRLELEDDHHLHSRIAHKRRRQNGKILLATTVGRGGGSEARTPSAYRSMAPATVSLPEERGQVYTTKHRQSLSRGHLVFRLETEILFLRKFCGKKIWTLFCL